MRCLRINGRGDRRYRIEDLDAFIAEAGRESAFRIAAAEARRENARATAEFLPELGRFVGRSPDLDAVLRELTKAVNQALAVPSPTSIAPDDEVGTSA